MRGRSWGEGNKNNLGDGLLGSGSHITSVHYEVRETPTSVL
mgnify:CR=1 FL=1|jgi:hypothetical protein